MNSISSKIPNRPLIWSDIVLDLQDELLGVITTPIYIVGGAVRDAYLHHAITDIDLAVPENAIATARKIANTFGGDLFVMDDERDVARVLLQTAHETQLIIDVARFRADTLYDDLLDRDFTMNAMAVDLLSDLNQLIDPLEAEIDISKKFIRRCSERSLSDDPIRCLRAIRQSVQFNFRIEPETLKDIRQFASLIPQVSSERIRDEFVKVLKLTQATKALRVASQLKILEQIIPDLSTLKNIDYISPSSTNAWQYTLLAMEYLQNLFVSISPRRTDQTAAIFTLGTLIMQIDRYRGELQHYLNKKWANERSHMTLLMLAILLHKLEYPEQSAQKYADALRLSNPEKKRLITIIDQYEQPLKIDLTPLSLHRFWYEFDENGVDICLLSIAHYLGHVHMYIEQDEWIQIVDRFQQILDVYFNQYGTLVKPPILLDGHQLMEIFELEPSPQIGELLTRIREGQVLGEITTQEQAIHAIREYLR